jgi:hypothetical protein
MEAYDYLKIISIIVCLMGLRQAFKRKLDYRDIVIVVWLVTAILFYVGTFLIEYEKWFANLAGATLRLYGYVMVYFMLRRFKNE